MDQSSTRLPDLVPIRYGRMLASPLAFFRGAAAIMASDLAATPQSGLRAQCSGDAHLLNFGTFASPERRLVFDLNDFDETLPGPWEWDVKRLAASLLIAAIGKDCSGPDQERVVLDTVGGYRTAMLDFAGMSSLAVWYSRADVDSLLTQFSAQLQPKVVKQAQKGAAPVQTHGGATSFSKLTETVNGQVRIVDRSPLIVPIERLGQGDRARQDLSDWLRQLVHSYRRSLPIERRVLLDQFEMVDAARKVVGVGSVGTRCWIVLLLGPDGKEPLFLQVKEADSSVLEPYVGKSPFSRHGERVVVGQRLMQAASDIFLGWLEATSEFDGKTDYYCRQLNDWKGALGIDQMRPDSLAAYGRLCGWALARAHARSGDRFALAAYLGTSPVFDRAILAFAKAYAAQNERDYQALQAAVKAGRITAEINH